MAVGVSLFASCGDQCVLKLNVGNSNSHDRDDWYHHHPLHYISDHGSSTKPVFSPTIQYSWDFYQDL